ncbi:MAG TPA: adenylate/guanylate cyclase domain-containing protein [Gaiellaceae bacterium]|nr:adenylate/guanylate cyclase domain-containing protein [Gaiellaceae bacterium]
MTCDACGSENPAGKRFCGDCGAPLGSACPSCGAENPAGKRFCGDCGAPLGAAAAPAAPAAREAPVAERRLVTVLFADLVGFTPLSESRDPEEVRELLSRYFDTTRRLIELYGGTVEKFIGDAVMAVWGTPVATEDDAERAVRAGLDLVAAVSGLGDEVGAPELRARAGVLTGDAAVTLGATSEGMVAGDLVNTAARIQAAAEPGTLLVGDATRRASEATVAFEDAGEHELKGKSEPVRLWRALRVVAGARGQLKSIGLEAPFVGRARELRLIKDLFHASADERKAHLVSITGIAGIGKSRIGWEFYKYFDGIAESVWWHRGRCLAYGEGVTYWALADMVRMRCRIAEDETVETGVEKVRATLLEHILDGDERAFVEPRLLQLLGWGGAEQGEKQQLFAAWRSFFERMADTNPVVLVFEDLQWADESLLDFVEYLLEWSRNQPIFVVTLARPELTEKRATWGAGQRAFTSIYLEPLAPAAMEELLAGLVPGMPPEVVQEILGRAEGIPLYAVETVRMLLDRGLIVEDGSSYRVVGEIGALDVPETLQALIAARLDGLEEGERALVQDAAVLGKTFGSALLARVAGRPEEEVETLLASLVRKEVLSLQADPRSPEHGQYGFLQDLVRRVAYETLARRDRKNRHLAAADQIASALGEEDVPEVVAAHLVAALEAAPEADDASAIKERAGRMFLLAGERAARLAAAGEAQHFYEQASELSDEPPAHAALVDRAGRMAWVAGRPEESRELLTRARGAYHDLGDEIAKALVDSKLAEIDFNDGLVREAVDRMTSALEAIERVGTPADVASTTAQLGRFLVFAREYEAAAANLERALSLAEEHQYAETLAHALNSKAVMMLYRNRRQESRLLVRGALAVALEHDLHDAALRAYNNVIAGSWYEARFREAVGLIDEALEYSRRTGERTWEVVFLIGRVGQLAFLGRWDEALESANAAEQYATTEFHRGLLLAAAGVYLRRGLVPQARALVDRLDTSQSENPEFAAGFYAAEAQQLAAEGRYDDAHAAALRAMPDVSEAAWWLYFDVAEVALTLPDDARSRDLLARLETASNGKRWRAVEAQLVRLRARFQAHDAISELERAEQMFRELGAPYYVAAVQAERAEHLFAVGRADEAQQLVADARETFERLGAVPALAALRRERAVA